MFRRRADVMDGIIATLCVALVVLVLGQRTVVAVDLVQHAVGAEHVANPLAGKVVDHEHDQVELPPVDASDAQDASPDDDRGSHRHLGDGSQTPSLDASTTALRIPRVTAVVLMAANAARTSSRNDGLLRPPRMDGTLLA